MPRGRLIAAQRRHRVHCAPRGSPPAARPAAPPPAGSAKAAPASPDPWASPDRAASSGTAPTAIPSATPANAPASTIDSASSVTSRAMPPGLRADRHAYADLPPPLQHSVVEHAVQARSPQAAAPPPRRTAPAWPATVRGAFARAPVPPACGCCVTRNSLPARGTSRAQRGCQRHRIRARRPHDERAVARRLRTRRSHRSIGTERKPPAESPRACFDTEHRPPRRLPEAAPFLSQ